MKLIKKTSTKTRPAGAQRGRSVAQRATGWVSLHVDCASDALRRLWQQPVASLMTLAVVAISLLLPSLLYVTGKNLNQFADSLQSANQLTAYLHLHVDDSAGRQLQQIMAQHSAVNRAEFISPEQAAVDFAQWSGLGDVIASLGENPLPASIVLYPADNSYDTAAMLRDTFVMREEIAHIQLDQDWLLRLERFMTLTQRGVVTLILVLALGVLFVIGNSIRTTIVSREAEIRVMKLIGATDGFIARPFLYSGFWIGLLGGVLAWLLLAAMLLLFHGPATSLLSFYGEQYQLYGLGNQATVILLGGSALLGWLGARLSVSRQLTRF
jgi:cell division transport system permease protein